MKIANSPTQLPISFAESGAKNTIPNTTTAPDLASWSLGFPPDTMKRPEEGGVPPHGMDFNGALGSISQLSRWYALGGHFKYNNAFTTAASVAGYPQGAIVLGNDGLTLWRSLVDDNVQDPNSGSQTQWSRVRADYNINVDTTGGVYNLSVQQSSATVLVVTGDLTADADIRTATGAPVDMIVFNSTDGNANVYVNGISIGTTGDFSRIASATGSVLTGLWVHDQSVLNVVRCGGSPNALTYANSGILQQPAPSGTLFRIIPAYTTTSTTVTIAITAGGGTTTYNIVNADGSPLPVGALQGGHVYLLSKQGSVVKMTYQVAAPITPQTWTDVTASRAASTDYTNTTNDNIRVSVMVNLSGNASAQLFIQGVAIATAGSSGVTQRQLMYGDIPPGAVYSVRNLNSASIYSWCELRS